MEITEIGFEVRLDRLQRAINNEDLDTIVDLWNTSLTQGVQGLFIRTRIDKSADQIVTTFKDRAYKYLPRKDHYYGSDLLLVHKIKDLKTAILEKDFVTIKNLIKDPFYAAVFPLIFASTYLRENLRPDQTMSLEQEAEFFYLLLRAEGISPLKEEKKFNVFTSFLYNVFFMLEETPWIEDVEDRTQYIGEITTELMVLVAEKINKAKDVASARIVLNKALPLYSRIRFSGNYADAFYHALDGDLQLLLTDEMRDR